MAAARGRCVVPFVNVKSPDTARRAFALVRRPGATFKKLFVMIQTLFAAFWGTLAAALVVALFAELGWLLLCAIRDVAAEIRDLF
jgi:hypothetical protein